jgi:2-methylcitrate dehydratase PrpD
VTTYVTGGLAADLSVAQQLGAFVESTRLEDLPAEVADSVGRRVLDTLGIAVAAASLDTSRAARRWAHEVGGRPAASGVGLPDRTSAPVAAFVNGVLAHSLDYDDTHLPSVLHPSAAVVPAALAAGERSGASGADVVRAVALGLEVTVRLGMAGYDEEAGNSVFFEHGQHATSICGALGGAVAATLLDPHPVLPERERVVHALGVAASMASGIIEANRTGGTVKRMHCGWAAHAALSAADLVRHGITGPPTVLEGRFGFFEAWLHGSVDLAAITAGLGTSWEVPRIFFKPYPANHFTHAIVDAASALRERGVTPDLVEEVVVGVPAANLRTVGEPIEVKRRPATGYMAQFSAPYAVTVGLLGGGGLGAALEDYDDALVVDPARLALMDRVWVEPDEECSRIFPRQFPAVLRARLRDGREVEEKVLTTRGGPERPLSFDELATKFRDNASRGLAPEDVERLQESCRTLPDLTDLRGLMAPLTRVDQIDLAART